MNKQEYKDLIDIEAKYIEGLDKLEAHLTEVVQYYFGLLIKHKILNISPKNKISVYLGYSSYEYEIDDWKDFLSLDNVEFMISHTYYNNTYYNKDVGKWTDEIYGILKQNILSYLESDWKNLVETHVKTIVDEKAAKNKTKKQTDSTLKKDKEALAKLEAECELLRRKIGK